MKISNLCFGFDAKKVNHPLGGGGVIGETHLLSAQGGNAFKIRTPEPRLSFADFVEKEDGNLVFDSQHDGIRTNQHRSSDSDAGKFFRADGARGMGRFYQESVVLFGEREPFGVEYELHFFRYLVLGVWCLVLGSSLFYLLGLWQSGIYLLYGKLRQLTAPNSSSGGLMAL